MATILNKISMTLRQLRWRLTLSYTAVTVGSLLVVGLIIGAVFFPKILVPDTFLSPEMMIEVANRSVVTIMRSILSQMPIDYEMFSIWV